MKRIAFIVATLLLAAPPAFAGLDLTWDGCNNGTGAQTVTLDCANPSAVSALVGGFQVPAAVDSFYLVDIVLDFQTEAASLPAFWQFDGCDAGGISLSLARPGIGCTDLVNPWGAGGVDGEVTRAFQTGVHGIKRGRMVVTIFLQPNAPIHLDAGTNYFAFRILFSTTFATEAGGSCAGCTSPVVVVWNSAAFTSIAAASPPPLVVTTSGLVGQCARANSATLPTCDATPTLNRTWGALKALYR